MAVGMLPGMTTKIAVSLPDDQVAAARTAVAEGRAPSVSAYVSEALARRSTEDELLQLLDEDDATATGTPTTDEHRAWARQALGFDQPASADAKGTPTRRSTRTATTGRYVSRGAATRHPSTAVAESPPSTRRRG
jgi:Arc/MetJ-type ribon-helix-helix transcriptional regulator